MAPIISELSHLANPLATSTQLETTSSRLDGIPKDLEDSIRYEASRYIQAAGIILRLPQELIAQSIVILQRFWVGQEGGSILDHNVSDATAAAMYIITKPSAHAVSPRKILTVLDFLATTGGKYHEATRADISELESWEFSEGDYERHRDGLYKAEAHILRVLGFRTHVALPYGLCITYLQALDVFKASHADGSNVAKRAFKHLNTALLSPQLLFLTHQPCALAAASIHLASCEDGVNLPECAWWEVFDVEQEDLGFLVLSMHSMQGYATQEEERRDTRGTLMVVKNIRAEMRQQQLER